MVKHIVMYKLKEGKESFSGEKAQKTKAALEALVGKIDGLLLLTVRAGYNPDGFDMCLYSEFTSKEALEQYLIHPEHVACKGMVHELICDRVVVDYEDE